MAKDILSIDYESYSDVSLPEVGTSVYANHASTEILMAAYALNESAVRQWVPAEGEPMPRHLQQALDSPDVEKRAWNANFEITMTRACIGPTDHRQWRCTMVQAMSCSLPGKLEKAGPVLNVPINQLKDTRGKALMRKFSFPRKPTKRDPRTRVLWEDDLDEWIAYKEYNVSDVEAERAIARRLRQYDMSEDEWELWFMDHEINVAGLPINRAMVDNAIKIYETVLGESFEEMREITGLANPNSGPQLLPWLQEQGYIYGDLKKGHIETAARYFKEKPDHWDEDRWHRYRSGNMLQRVLELRRETSRTSIKKYYALQRATDNDGMLRFTLQMNGAARTGRWGGRLYQPQNLVKPEKRFEEIQPQIADAIEHMDAEEIKMVYGNVFDVLATGIRTSAQAPEGYVFIDADLSAIENRVLGWLAECKKILAVFHNNMDPYISFATYLFDQPYDKLWHEYKVEKKGAKRTIAKPGTLGCGYAMGAGEARENEKTGEIEATGLLGYAWNMGIRHFTQADSKHSVDTFRREFSEVKSYWYDIERAMRRCIKTGKATSHGVIRFTMEGPFLNMWLPSGRPLRYLRPKLENKPTPWGEVRLQITYEGLNDRKQWVRMHTTPGKITENCFNEDTLILTGEGKKRIVDVTEKDLIWDGFAFVEHGGVVFRGFQKTVDFGGVKVTEDHKVNLGKEWKRIKDTSFASATAAFQRYFRLPKLHACGGEAARNEWEINNQGSSLRLREAYEDRSVRNSEDAAEVMRVRPVQSNFKSENNSRHDEASSVLSLALNVSPVQQLQTRGFPQLRRSWNISLPILGKQFFEFLGRHVQVIRERTLERAERQHVGVFPRKLSMGQSKRSMQKYSVQPQDRNFDWLHDDSRSFGEVWDKKDDASVSFEHRVSSESYVRPARRSEPVYDILNCGPRHQFTVVSPSGSAFVAHNCDQAISRDLLAHGMKLAKKRGLGTLRLHVHDQLVGLAKEDQAEAQLAILMECMNETPRWADGLPLGSAGQIAKVMVKD